MYKLLFKKEKKKDKTKKKYQGNRVLLPLFKEERGLIKVMLSCSLSLSLSLAT
jgi:hypothetical protein